MDIQMCMWEIHILHTSMYLCMYTCMHMCVSQGWGFSDTDVLLLIVRNSAHTTHTPIT